MWLVTSLVIGVSRDLRHLMRPGEGRNRLKARCSWGCEGVFILPEARVCVRGARYRLIFMPFAARSSASATANIASYRVSFDASYWITSDIAVGTVVHFFNAPQPAYVIRSQRGVDFPPPCFCRCAGDIRSSDRERDGGSCED